MTALQAPSVCRRRTRRFLDDIYMHKRIHSSLGDLTPVESETEWRRSSQTREPIFQVRNAKTVSSFGGPLQPPDTYRVQTCGCQTTADRAHHTLVRQAIRVATHLLHA